MRHKSTIADFNDQSDSAIDNGARRASGRVRKPTAKAVALNGNKSYSPPLEDTIVIGKTSSPGPGPSPNTKLSPNTLPHKSEPQETQMQPAIPDSPEFAKIQRIISLSPEVAVEDAPLPVVEPTPTRRQSLRERKLTEKASSETLPSKKRPATDDPENAPVRKSTRISLSGPKVPSKLRYSVSSSPSVILDAESEEMIEVPAAKRSKIVVLRYRKQANLSKSPKQPKAKPHSATAKRRTRKAPERQKITEKELFTDPAAYARPLNAPQSCNLTCLSPSSRLYAFAQIAARMPDEDDDNEEVVLGSANDWRTYIHAWCQCGQVKPPKAQRTNSAELARALMPNTVAQGTKQDPVDLSKPHPPEEELLLTPVNTILRASDAERLSQLYSGPGDRNASQSFSGLRSTSSKRPFEDLSVRTNNQPSQGHVSISESPYHQSPLGLSTSYPTRRTYEDRLRDDYNELAEIRKRAAARGIPWTYNQTFDEVHALVVEAEDLEQQSQYRQQVINPPTVLGRAHEASETRPSPTGFGVLLPPKGSTFIQRNSSGQNHYAATSTLTNGAAGPSTEPPKPSKISFVEETNPANPSKARRPSSPSRPKSSRFRVDPRGLQGRSPGPGTIINMEDMRKKAQGLQRLAKAMQKMRASQELAEARQREERRLKMEQSERDAAERMVAGGEVMKRAEQA